VEFYLIQFALLGILTAVSAVILVRGILPGKGDAIVAAGYFLWLWSAGGILITLLYVANAMVSNP
jgi:hypothetical protein